MQMPSFVERVYFFGNSVNVVELVFGIDFFVNLKFLMNGYEKNFNNVFFFPFLCFFFFQAQEGPKTIFLSSDFFIRQGVQEVRRAMPPIVLLVFFAAFR